VTEAKFVGVDVKGNSIEVAVRPTDELWTAHAGDEGVAEVADRLNSLRPELVVLEARGRWELPVAGALAMMGLPFAMIPPNSIRDFARALGRTRRDDQLQAGLLARFAELVHPDPQNVPTEVVQHLTELQNRRRELLEMLTLERTRLNPASPVINKDVQSHLQFLEKALAFMSEQYNRTVRLGRVWR
jgi:transposase